MLLSRADASTEDRIGAALALTANHPAGADHVRVAAQACADPKMRIVLESVADGAEDDAAIAEALGAADVSEGGAAAS